MREIEAIMGLQEAERAAYGHADPLASCNAMAQQLPGVDAMLKRLHQVREGMSLHEALDVWLFRTPIQGSPSRDTGDAAVIEPLFNAYLTELPQ